MPTLPALGSLGQEDCHEFRASLGYRAWPWLTLPLSPLQTNKSRKPRFNTCIFCLLLGCEPLTVCYISAEDSCLQGYTEHGHYSPFLALLKYFPNLVMGDIILVWDLKEQRIRKKTTQLYSAFRFIFFFFLKILLMCVHIYQFWIFVYECFVCMGVYCTTRCLVPLDPLGLRTAVCHHMGAGNWTHVL